jgi:oxygen-independent coproporphyrinogen-3 oxidase
MKLSELGIDDELLLRLSGPGPRYTSYPTVPEWKDVGDADARAAYRRAASAVDEPFAIYVHVPFCARLCFFCGCTVEITKRRDKVERYLGALEREIDIVSKLLGPRKRVAQIHLGGGTPTHLSPDELRRVHGMIASRFAIQDDAELSIEVHPHVTKFEQVDALTELGFTRFSMGVQDLDEHVQEIIHRHQTTDETAELVAHCRKRGVESVNLDLMYGLPDQTEATFARTLADIGRIRPDRLAVYGYAHVPWLKPAQKTLEQYALPDPKLRARLFGVALEELSKQGYEVVGLDHFALPTDSLYKGLFDGTLHRNFMGYTNMPARDMVSFGMSAIADVGGTFLQNQRTTREYEEAIDKGELAAHKGLVRTGEDELRRRAILDLMCRMRLDLDELEAHFDRDDLASHFASEWRALEPYAREGLCAIEPRRVTVTEKGRLFLRHLAMAFDAYLRSKKPEGPRFSQTV